jgi:glycosyltransferase involved in cell wall biosynthesis
MKILWISHLLPYPPKGGVMQRSYNMLREISKYNDVDFITLYQKAHHLPLVEESLEAGIKDISSFAKVLGVYSVCSDCRKINKIFNLSAGLITTYPYMYWWLKSRTFSNAIRLAVEENEYDIYYFDTIALSQYLTVLIEKKGIKVINHHNIESQVMYRRSNKEKNIFKSLYFLNEARKRKNLEKNKCRLFDHNIVVSSLDKNRLEKITGKISCSIVPNGVDLDYFMPRGIAQNKNQMIFIGGLTFYPNIAAIRFILDEVWTPLKKKFPTVKFYIVGRNPPEDIKAFAQIDPSVVVTGFVDDIRKLMEESSVYVCPITDGGGTRLKILDALAMGKALVAHPIACEGIDVIHNKNVLLAKNTDEFINFISLFFHDSNKRIDFGKQARELIKEKYSYEKIGLDLHDDLCEHFKRRKEKFS